MVLMQIISVMSEHKIRRDVAFQFFEASFDFTSSVGEKTVRKVFDSDILRSGLLQKNVGALTSLDRSLIIGAKNNPIHSRPLVGFKQSQDCPSATYFDVVTVCSQAQDSERRVALLSEAQTKH